MSNSTISPPERKHVQQLKSIRDDLCNRAKENETLITTIENKRTNRDFRRCFERVGKLKNQIEAINLTIIYLETQIKY